MDTGVRYPCPLGTYQQLFIGDFSFCSEAKYSTIQASTSSATCLPCPKGKHQSSEAASVCSICAAGHFSRTEGASKCVRCSPGSYQPLASSSVCSACRPGTYTSRRGGTVCILCRPGSYKRKNSLLQDVRAVRKVHFNRHLVRRLVTNATPGLIAKQSGAVPARLASLANFRIILHLHDA